MPDFIHTKPKSTLAWSQGRVKQLILCGYQKNRGMKDTFTSIFIILLRRDIRYINHEWHLFALKEEYATISSNI